MHALKGFAALMSGFVISTITSGGLYDMHHNKAPFLAQSTHVFPPSLDGGQSITTRSSVEAVPTCHDVHKGRENGVATNDNGSAMIRSSLQVGNYIVRKKPVVACLVNIRDKTFVQPDGVFRCCT
jgi:hypothetical protein